MDSILWINGETVHMTAQGVRETRQADVFVYPQVSTTETVQGKSIYDIKYISFPITSSMLAKIYT